MKLRKKKKELQKFGKRMSFSFFLWSLQKYYWCCLFWVGFERLGGAFLKLVSKAFWGSLIAPFKLASFDEDKETDTSSLLGWFLLSEWISLSWWRDSREDMRIWIRIKAKRTTKVLVVLMLFWWKEEETSNILEAGHKMISYQGRWQRMLFRYSLHSSLLKE